MSHGRVWDASCAPGFFSWHCGYLCATVGNTRRQTAERLCILVRKMSVIGNEPNHRSLPSVRTTVGPSRVGFSRGGGRFTNAEIRGSQCDKGRNYCPAYGLKALSRHRAGMILYLCRYRDG